MTIPEDLTVDISGGKVILRSGDKYIEIVDTERKAHLFPMAWPIFTEAFVRPALARLTKLDNPRNP